MPSPVSFVSVSLLVCQLLSVQRTTASAITSMRNIFLNEIVFGCPLKCQITKGEVVFCIMYRSWVNIGISVILFSFIEQHNFIYSACAQVNGIADPECFPKNKSFSGMSVVSQICSGSKELLENNSIAFNRFFAVSILPAAIS